jgi:hypothetical protein
MLRLFLQHSRRCARALAAGASLKAILATGLDERLLRLGEVPPGEMEATGGSLMTEIDETLKRLEGA